MKQEKLDMTFRSEAWFAMWHKPEGNNSAFDREERGRVPSLTPW